MQIASGDKGHEKMQIISRDEGHEKMQVVSGDKIRTMLDQLLNKQKKIQISFPMHLTKRQ